MPNRLILTVFLHYHFRTSAKAPCWNLFLKYNMRFRFWLLPNIKNVPFCQLFYFFRFICLFSLITTCRKCILVASYFKSKICWTPLHDQYFGIHLWKDVTSKTTYYLKIQVSKIKNVVTVKYYLQYLSPIGVIWNITSNLNYAYICSKFKNQY